MRNKIIQSLFPFAAILFAIFSAFALNPTNHHSTALYSGYKKVGGICVDTGVLCTDDNTQIICKDATGATLYKHVGPTSCVIQLWKPVP